MKKNLLKISLLATAFAFIFSACSDNDDAKPWVEPEFSSVGAFILNEGNFGGNDSKLSYYNIEKDVVTSSVFENKNAEFKEGGIGGNAQDAVIYGSKMYIAVTESDKIFITDLEGKLIAEKGVIDLKDGSYTGPRYIVAHGGYVYIDFYSGHLAKIDTTSLTLEAKNVIEIPKFSEQMTVANNELYITNSKHPYGGDLPGNTITTINLGTFTKGTPIEVRANPSKITSDKQGNVYVASMGVYGTDVKNAVSVIDNKTKEVKILGENLASFNLHIQDNRLLMAYKNWDNFTTNFKSYDTYKQEFIEKPFLTIPEEHKKNVDNVYSITTDPFKEDIYLTTAEDGAEGYVYIFSKSGEYKTSHRSGGFYPNKVVFVSQQTN